MPARNRIKTYFSPGFYHLYNRGADGRELFREKQDYVVFLRLLKDCLIKPPPPNPEEGATPLPYPHVNLHKEIDLLSLVLMTNHYHFLLRQTTPRAMETMIRSIATRYSMYFNKKYERSGTLFQGIYRAVIVETEEQLLHLSRYIHRNPLEILMRDRPSEGTVPLESYEWSSYPHYLGLKKYDWLKPEIILAGRTPSAYQSFVEGKEEPSFPTLLNNLTLD